MYGIFLNLLTQPTSAATLRRVKEDGPTCKPEENRKCRETLTRITDCSSFTSIGTLIESQLTGRSPKDIVCGSFSSDASTEICREVKAPYCRDHIHSLAKLNPWPERTEEILGLCLTILRDCDRTPYDGAPYMMVDCIDQRQALDSFCDLLRIQDRFRKKAKQDMFDSEPNYEQNVLDCKSNTTAAYFQCITHGPTSVNLVLLPRITCSRITHIHTSPALRFQLDLSINSPRYWIQSVLDAHFEHACNPTLPTNTTSTTQNTTAPNQNNSEPYVTHSNASVACDYPLIINEIHREIKALTTTSFEIMRLSSVLMVNMNLNLATNISRFEAITRNMDTTSSTIVATSDRLSDTATDLTLGLARLNESATALEISTPKLEESLRQARLLLNQLEQQLQKEQTPPIADTIDISDTHSADVIDIPTKKALPSPEDKKGITDSFFGSDEIFSILVNIPLYIGVTIGLILLFKIYNAVSHQNENQSRRSVNNPEDPE